VADRFPIEGCEDSGGEILDVDEPEADVVEGSVAQRPVERAAKLVADGRMIGSTVNLAREDDQDRRTRRDPLFSDLVGAVLRFVVPAEESVRKVAPV
jgi:hypothetical protein